MQQEAMHVCDRCRLDMWVMRWSYCDAGAMADLPWCWQVQNDAISYPMAALRKAQRLNVTMCRVDNISDPILLELGICLFASLLVELECVYSSCWSDCSCETMCQGSAAGSRF